MEKGVYESPDPASANFLFSHLGKSLPSLQSLTSRFISIVRTVDLRSVQHNTMVVWVLLGCKETTWGLGAVGNCWLA